MFSRQASRTVRAATLHPAASLREGPARNFTGTTNDSRPPVYLYGLDGTYATALVCRCVVLSNGPMRLC
jgi:F-type H+-transporting ATPase subunit O